MSNSTTHLDLVSSSQAQKEVTVNAALDAASPAMLYGRRASTSTALTWGYYGGVVSIDGTPTQVSNGTVALAASTTNYVEADPATGAVSANTTGFTAGQLPLYQVVAGGSTVTSYTDLRILGGGAAAPVSSVNGQTGDVVLDASDVGADPSGAATAAVGTHAGASDPHPQYVLESTVGQANGVASLGSDGKVPLSQLPTAGAQPFDATVFYPGVPTASAIIDIEFARAVQFAANFAGSALKARVAAAGTTVVAVLKNGSAAGTATFSAGGTVAAFSAAAVTFNAGDFMSLVFPSTPDATLANIRGVMVGTR